MSPIADDEVLVGISVTRAMKYHGGPLAFSEDDATALLRKKLAGLLRAREGVCDAQTWTRQILHVWAEHEHIVGVLERVLNDPTRIDPALWHRTIIVCTLSPMTTMKHVVFKNETTWDLPVPVVAPLTHDQQVARLRHQSNMVWRLYDGSLVRLRR